MAYIRLASLLAAALLAVPAWSGGSTGGYPRALAISMVFLEDWTNSSFYDEAGMLFNDTDKDGSQEMVVYGRAKESWGVTIYDMPGFSERWSRQFQNCGLKLDFVDLGRNGSVQLLLTTTWQDHFCLTVVSGEAFETVWNSPAFLGMLNPAMPRIADVDADGLAELLFMNRSIANDSGTYVQDNRLQIFSTGDFQKEWESPGYDSYTLELSPVNLDADPALELILCSSDSRYTIISVYDGASHDIQWNRTYSAPYYQYGLEYIGDTDNDSKQEVAISSLEVDATTNDLWVGFQVLSGTTGLTEWNYSIPYLSGFSDYLVSDINSDGVQELLVQDQADGDLVNGPVNRTHRAIELKGYREIWRTAPADWIEGSFENSFLSAQDVTGDGVPELLMDIYSYDLDYHRSQLMTILDGRTFAERWRSPPANSSWYTLSSPNDLDGDGVRELVVGENWQTNESIERSRLHIVRTDTFETEWRSGDFKGWISNVSCLQAVNDSRPELFVTYDYKYYRLFDTSSHDQLWSGGGWSFSPPIFADLSGDGRNDILLTQVNETGGVRASMVLFNGTTFKESWRSTPIDGIINVIAAGDFDRDLRCELAVIYRYSYSKDVLVVWEAYEGYPPMPDAALSAGDLSLAPSPLYDGMRIQLRADLRNTGSASFGPGDLAFLLDGAAIGQCAAYVKSSSSRVFEVPCIAREGKHTLTVLADPKDTIPEWDESNNNASLDFTVLPAPPPQAAILSPREGEVFIEETEVLFNGSSGLPPEMAEVEYDWTSGTAGLFGSAKTLTRTMPLGRHLVTLNVTSHGLRSTATVNITVTPDYGRGPKAMISSPEDGSTFLPDQPIFFDGRKSDPGERMFRLSYKWSSDILGPLGKEASFERGLSVGNHNITLEVDDAHGGISSASVVIMVWDPSVVIAAIRSPYEGQSFEENRTILLDAGGTYSSTERPLRFDWSSNVSGSLGSGERLESKLPAGKHHIALEVSDDRDHHGRATVNISVLAAFSHPPSVRILFPAEGASVNGLVTVSGVAQDAVRVMAVDIRIDDGPWFAAAGADNWTFAWNTSRVVNGPHRVTVRATDGSRSSPDFSVNLTVSNPGTAGSGKPPATGSSAPTLAAIAGALLAAAAGLSLLLSRRRTRAKAKGPAAFRRRPTSRP